ncbi:MAG: DUF1800 domain-containing protein [Candidatus Korobacteraceae bacterium]
MNRRRYWVLATLLVLLTVSLAAKKQKQTHAPDDPKRALHALDRLTFGPRPGDVQAVAAMGVDKWIDLQLHPEQINDSVMQSRLAGYRTLQMSTREMVLAFPPNPIVKAVMDGKMAMPRDPNRRAIYAAAIAREQEKQQKKQNTATDANAAIGNAPAPASQAAPGGAVVKPADLTQNQMARREAHSAVDDLILMAPAQRMNRILSMPAVEQHDLLQGVPLFKRLALLAGLTPEQRETVIALNRPEAVIDNEVRSAKLLRAVYSDRQLEEVLTDFWFNHFNIFIGKGADHYLVTSYERDVIRPHVLGKFKDLLIATAQSPAMLFYLDNRQSEGPDSDAALGKPANPGPRAYMQRRGIYPPPARTQQPNPQANQQQKRRSGLNENYARELMELHTLGVNGGYTQHDVTEVARVFTGWTLDQPGQGGGFIYRPPLHEPGDKIVLGHHIKDAGESEGLEVLNLLASQPATARFVSTELAQRFVSDNPPPTLIDAMSKSYLRSDGDIRQVLETMFHSREFWAPEAYRARVKTPFEFVVSSLRATQAEVTDPQPLLATLNKMGEQLYGCQPPTGYSTKSDVWVNSAALLDRMNFGLTLTTNKLPGTTFDLAQLMAYGTSGSSSPQNNGVASTATAAMAPARPQADSAPASDNMLNAASTAPPAAATNETIDPYQVQLTLEQTLLAGDVSKQTHDTIQERIVSPENVAENQNPNRPPNVNVIAGLLLGSPEFQRK